MADVETKETTVASPEKKVVEEVIEKKEKEVKEVEEVDEDSRASENGDAKEVKENGEEKPVEEKEPESTENGDSTDAPADACCIKRKSTAGVEASADAPDGVSPEKKAKIEEKPVETAESNGETETAA
ncbi:neurofilament medium polypeptide-like [Diachasmimorpha longicaudata]|uniref:neurofilament medium polypeptide-like n=1 Tax=Diachasmimorpha longicaudata TaxID=58733 RepID=UPI0030B8F6C5